MVSLMNKINCVRRQDARLVLEDAVDDVIHNLPPYLRIQSRYRVIHQVNVAILINSSCQADPRLLPSTQIHSPLPNLSHITRLKLRKITFQFTILNRINIPFHIHGPIIQNIIPNNFILNPGYLVGVGKRALYRHRRLGILFVLLIYDVGLQPTRFLIIKAFRKAVLAAIGIYQLVRHWHQITNNR